MPGPAGDELWRLSVAQLRPRPDGGYLTEPHVDAVLAMLAGPAFVATSPTIAAVGTCSA